MNPEQEFIPDNDPLPDVPEDIQLPSDIIEKGGTPDDGTILEK